MSKNYPYLTHLDTSCKNIHIGATRAFYNALYLAMVKYNIKHNIKHLSKQYMSRHISPLVPDWYFHSFCRIYNLIKQIKVSEQRIQMLTGNIKRVKVNKNT